MSCSRLLNEDLIAEILTWLPPKAIIQFRCVSKRWLSLSSNPHFIKRNASCNTNPSITGFFLRDDIYHTKYFSLRSQLPCLPDPSLSFLPTDDGQRSPISINSSCNGLVICCRANRQSFTRSTYYVCNPTTMEYAQLPMPKGIDHYLSLVFNPAKSPHYKVVSIGFKIHIYSSETRQWRMLVEGPRQFTLHLYRSVFWNDKLVWIGKESLLSFNVETEHLRQLPMPTELQLSQCLHVGESRGRLHMIVSAKDELTATQFDILVWDQDCSGWFVLYRIDLTCIKEVYPDIKTQSRMRRSIRRASASNSNGRLAVSPVFFIGGEAEEEMLLLSVPGKILSYHIRNKKFQEICDAATPSRYYKYQWWKFYLYSHTLCSLAQSSC